MKKSLLTFGILVGFMVLITAQNPEKRQYKAKRIEQDKPVIDGKLSETLWEGVFWDNSFVQFEPYNLANATQKTQFAILYDDEFVYVGLKMFDTAPDSIVKRMTRRDDIDGDFALVGFDSFHDLRTSFTFMVSAAGVKLDLMHTNDGDSEDSTWDPIWWTKTSSDDKGWYAEMKIPFTQLRFGDDEIQTWGLEVGRQIYRMNELSFWNPIPRDAGGLVHNFGELEIEKIKPKKIFDIVPYGVAGLHNYESEDGNPFMPGTDFKYNIGLDGKVGLTNNLTLDFTVNPDFGQVESDPSEVNLSAYETFLEEKRPFFIEGRNILNFPVMFGDGGLGAENLFYSRRIGRRPHHDPDLNDDEYAYIPNNTSIISAAKITGKTNSGWSIGILESVTQKEYAEIEDNGTRRTETVEPLTNYTVSRLQKDYNNGNTIIGVMLTSTNRIIEEEDSHLDWLHTSAFSGGVDYTQFWNDKKWMLKVNNVFSNVNGSEDAIYETQTSSARYFQRPDADYVTLDPTRTSLSGYGGNIQIGKVGGGNFKFMNFFAWKSPGLETNDIGYLRSADEIFHVVWGQYRMLNPYKELRSFSFNTNAWDVWDFGGRFKGIGGNINISSQFMNYWGFEFGLNADGPTHSNSFSRGGSEFIVPGSYSGWFWLGSNNQKKLRVTLNGSAGKGFLNNSERYSVNMSITYKPINTLSLTVRPSFSDSRNDLQYVTNGIEFNNEDRYVFGTLNQKLFMLSLRVNYNLTPDLSIQFWGQPFITSGKYDDYKYITDGINDEFANRFDLYSENQIRYDAADEGYYIDENVDGTDDYSFGLPDFNYKEFLSNFVVRWEYNPGSTVFFVWSQNRNHVVSDGVFNLGNDFADLFNYNDDKSYNVFLVKFSYRFGL